MEWTGCFPWGSPTRLFARPGKAAHRPHGHACISKIEKLSLQDLYPPCAGTDRSICSRTMGVGETRHALCLDLGISSSISSIRQYSAFRFLPLPCSWRCDLRICFWGPATPDDSSRHNGRRGSFNMTVAAAAGTVVKPTCQLMCTRLAKAGRNLFPGLSD